MSLQVFDKQGLNLYQSRNFSKTVKFFNGCHVRTMTSLVPKPRTNESRFKL